MPQFVHELATEATRLHSDLLSSLLTTAVIVLAVDFVTNVCGLIFVLLHERNNPDFADFVSRHTGVVGGLCLLSTTNIRCFTALYSRLGALDVFSSPPMSQQARSIIDTLGLLGVAIEGLPMLIVQVCARSFPRVSLY